MEPSIANGMLSRSLDSHASFDYPIIVHSHLRWDWVWQRPQQFLSRLSKQHRVLFVEHDFVVTEGSTPTYSIHEAKDYPNITILKLHIPEARKEQAEYVDNARYSLVKTALKRSLDGKFEKPVQWFYDPCVAPVFLDRMDEIGVVYDCMDQLSQFRGAPAKLVEREKQLLAAADIVFAGGRKLWEQKKVSNNNCHFFGCGVDLPHFGSARKESTPVPDDVKSLPRPILGYIGVVDERLDYDLLKKLAEANPEASVCIVGPVCKVEESDLPRCENIHWLGGREYEQLPSYAKAFDVCMMPFALNEATEYINPTKALEYMATGTPIVSSAVPDVVTNFASAVSVAYSQDEYIAMCRSAATSPDKARVERGLKMAAAQSWDSTIAQMEKLMRQAISMRATKAAISSVQLSPASGKLTTATATAAS